MKKDAFFSTMLCLTLTGLLLFNSCNEERVQPVTEQSQIPPPQATIFPCEAAIAKIKFQNGMLAFDDIQHFEEVVSCLESAVDMWNDAFEMQYGHLSDDEVEQIEESIGFNEDKPLADLEAMYNFSSLRAHIEGQMANWLDNSTLDFNNIPDDHSVLDEETRTLLTPDCKAIIGGVVVDFCDPYHNGGSGPEQMIPLCSIANNDCCWWGSSKGRAFYDNENKLYIVYVRLKNKIGFGVPSKVKAKVISCKKKSNGKWKRYRTNLRILAGGQYHTDNSCETIALPVAKQKPSNGSTIRRKKLRVADNLWFQGIRRALANEIAGTAFVGKNQLEFLSVPLIF